MCVCVCEREREREREKEVMKEGDKRGRQHGVCVRVRVCVCEREREREREVMKEGDNQGRHKRERKDGDKGGFRVWGEQMQKTHAGKCVRKLHLN